MVRIVRVVTLIAALLIVAVYFFPLWGISLVAPQYPEGLSIDIWINKVTGDVRNINVLNHYIGMAKIEPENIPELKSFPYLFGFLIGTGVLAAILNRPKLYKLWAALVLAGALLGLYDFYAWEYRYGHEISDDAPMKLEDSYQPPLIGTKQLANITASSWPKTAGYAFSASAMLAVLILLLPITGRRPKSFSSSVALLCLILSGCSPSSEVQDVRLGRDECDTCRMVIVDGRFGGELITQKGKIYKFDSIDCMKNYFLKNREHIGKVFAFDYNTPGKLLPAENAFFYKLDNMRSPMGEPIVALATSSSAGVTNFVSAGPGVSWNQIVSGDAG